MRPGCTWRGTIVSSRATTAQSKIFVKNSPDGMDWTATAAPMDDNARGHQYFPDLASSGGTLSLVFYDSRNDAAYDAFVPPGVTKEGRSSGGAVDTFLASSSDGGRSWSERRISSLSSNYNLEAPGPVPFWGDYIYVSAVAGTVVVVWTDSRDVRLGDSGGGLGGEDGFDIFEPCGSPRAFANNPCLSKGGHDQNIYAARL